MQIVVTNFDALAQASGFRIKRRQVVFLCWMQDSKLGNLRHQIARRLNAHSQTDWAIEAQAKALTQQPFPMMNEHWLCCQLAFASVIYMILVVDFDALAQASNFKITRRQVVFHCWMQYSKLGSLRCSRREVISNWKENSCLPLLNAGFEPRVSRNWISSRLNAHWQTDWNIEDHAKNLNSIAHPYWSVSI